MLKMLGVMYRLTHAPVDTGRFNSKTRFLYNTQKVSTSHKFCIQREGRDGYDEGVVVDGRDGGAFFLLPEVQQQKIDLYVK